MDREKRLNVRVTEQELKMLKALAEAEGLKPSEYLRFHIRSAYAQRFSKSAPRKR